MSPRLETHELSASGCSADRRIDGRNLIGVLQGRQTKSPHKTLAYDNGTNLRAVRQGRWKLHLPRTPSDQPVWSEEPRHTWKGFVSLDEFRLFDLDVGRGEQNDLAEQHSEVVARLRAVAGNTRKELGDARSRGTDQRKIKLAAPQER